MSTSTQPAKPCRFSVEGWWTWIGITSAGLACLYYAYFCYCQVTEAARAVAVFVKTADGLPVANVVLRLDNGKIVDVDEGGNAVIPADNVGKPISIRCRATNRELRVFSCPRIADQHGPLEIVVPANAVPK